VTLTSGSFDGCNWQIQLQTQDQRPTTQGSPSGGTCDPDAGSCYNFPAATDLPFPTSSTMTITKAFTDFSSSVTSPTPATKQIVGVQWQMQGGNPVLDDAGVAQNCVADFRIDDVKFIKQ
jgi:hypothetical protein